MPWPFPEQWPVFLPLNFTMHVCLSSSVFTKLMMYSAAGLGVGGQRRTGAHAVFLHTVRLSLLPWRSLIISAGNQIKVQLQYLLAERINILSFKVIRNHYHKPHRETGQLSYCAVTALFWLSCVSQWDSRGVFVKRRTLHILVWQEYAAVLLQSMVLFLNTPKNTIYNLNITFSSRHFLGFVCYRAH